MTVGGWKNSQIRARAVLPFARKTVEKRQKARPKPVVPLYKEVLPLVSKIMQNNRRERDSSKTQQQRRARVNTIVAAPVQQPTSVVAAQGSSVAAQATVSRGVARVGRGSTLDQTSEPLPAWSE
jgi:hypothetical protein